MNLLVKAPRFRKRMLFMFDLDERVGDAAGRVASQCRYGSGDHTFAWDGRVIDSSSRVGDVLIDQARVELVLR